MGPWIGRNIVPTTCTPDVDHLLRFVMHVLNINDIAWETV